MMLSFIKTGFSKWDVYAFIIMLACLAFFSEGLHGMHGPMADSVHRPVALDTAYLPKYALLTSCRMFAGILISFLFAVVYATLAAKNKLLEKILIPFLDILQSIPVFGYISFTVTGFLALFPGDVMGIECAVVFAIFTAQAWNMTFSLYQSLTSIPKELVEASQVFGLNPIQRFFKLELPYATPGLIWNTMMSMSGAWFFIVASEAVTVGSKQFYLPGMGSYIATAVSTKNMHCIAYAFLTMILTIFIYDQVIFKPLVKWAEKFRYEMTASSSQSTSWCYSIFKRTRLLPRLFLPLRMIWRILLAMTAISTPRFSPLQRRSFNYFMSWLFYSFVLVTTIYGAEKFYVFAIHHIELSLIIHCIYLGFLTFLRIAAMMVLATAIWLPIGIYIGLRPNLVRHVQPLVQMLAAFPANFLYPLFAILLATYHLNPNIWLSFLIIFGTQWYILFNVIAGASVFPNDLREAASNFHIHKWLWWKKVILPGVFPYFLTGAITAWGGAWNATLVSELISWGDKQYIAKGLGAFITDATNKGNMIHVTVGIAVMVLYVITVNRLLWRPLYRYAEQKLTLG